MTKAERRTLIARRSRARKVSEAQRKRWEKQRVTKQEAAGISGDPWDDVMDLLERLG